MFAVGGVAVVVAVLVAAVVVAVVRSRLRWRQLQLSGSVRHVPPQVLAHVVASSRVPPLARVPALAAARAPRSQTPVLAAPCQVPASWWRAALVGWLRSAAAVAGAFVGKAVPAVVVSWACCSWCWKRASFPFLYFFFRQCRVGCAAS